jgi:glycogen debranching enzyme
MEILIAKDLSKNSYILAGKRAFFHRFCDTGFKTKWTGLWYNGKKFVEYFAFKINNTWLSPLNCLTFLQNETKCSHNFLLDGMKITENLFIPEKFGALVCILNFENQEKERKKVEVELELAVNIREMEENWHPRTYEAKFGNEILINSEKGCLAFYSSLPINFEYSEKYKDHYPGELQRCFIPGNCKVNFLLEPFSKNDLIFIFSCGNSQEEALKNLNDVKSSIFSLFLEKERECKKILSTSFLQTGIPEIDELFRASIISLEKLAFNSNFGFCYFAGYPWFTQFWGRDLGWILPAVVDCGNFEAARESLKTLANFQKNGKIPNIIFPNGKTDYNSIDSTPLWIISLYHYAKNSGDFAFLKEMEGKLNEALNWLKSNQDENGFLKHGPRETWMDTFDRSFSIEAQVFLIEALKSAGKIFKILGEREKSNELIENAKRIEKNFEKKFWNEEEKFYFDLNSKIKTINAIFPVFFGISENWKKVLEKIESEEFTTDFGVRSIAKSEKIYDPAGYHTGSSWGWLVGLVACAEFKNNRAEKGFEYLKKLFDRLNKRCLFAIDEAWNSENGEALLSKPNFLEESALLQGWSSALVIRCIDEFMLGIKQNAFEKTIFLQPSLLEGMKVLRRKRIGNDIVDLFIERKNNKVSASYKSLNKEKYEIVFLPKESYSVNL